MAIDLGAQKEAINKPKVNLSKTLTPRNEIVTVTGLSFRKNEMNDGYDIYLEVVGKDMTEFGFEGFFIDKEDESLGRHKGSVGRVKLSQYSFATKTFPARNGRAEQTVDRDATILAELGKVAKICGRVDELFEGSVENIEMLISKANTVLAGAEINLCIGGKEYDSNGYTKYDLFLPKTDKGLYAMETPGVTPSYLQQFDPAKHIVRKAASAVVVDSFEAVETEFSV